jgi:hypothetical protein
MHTLDDPNARAEKNVRIHDACRLCGFHVDTRSDSTAIWIAPAARSSKRQVR